MASNNVRHMNERVKVTDIARYCMVSRITVRRWIKSGKLPAFRLPSGHYRINVRDFREFLKRWNIPTKGALLESKSKRKEDS